jgi:hypothetical protein
MKQTPKSLFPYYKKVDLSDKEIWREYRFSDEEKVRIRNPHYLIVSDNGHRIMDLNGVAHYIPYGWIELIWKPKEGHEFYCERSEELNDLDAIDLVENQERIKPPRSWPDSPEDEPEKIETSLDQLEKLRAIFNASVSPLVNGFLRYISNQLDNANRNKNTIEYQTLGRVEEKFIYLFESWMETENEQEEEPEQSSTESTE